MSRGLGRIQLAIVNAFERRPGTILRTAQLIACCYSGVPYNRKHAVSAHRAARRLAEEYPHLYERIAGTQGTIYTDATHSRSLAIGRIYGLRRSFSLAKCEAEIDDPKSEAFTAAQRGGSFDLVAERNRLLADELYEEARSVMGAIEAIHAAHRAKQNEARPAETTLTEIAA